MKNICLKLAFSLGVFVAAPAWADGQSVPINYDNLSFFEEPLAAEVGPVTLNANLLADQAVQYNTTTEKDTYNTILTGSFRAETELPNSWQIGAQYFSRYSRLDDDEYSDNVAVFISDEWGTLAGGNVTGSVTEKVRRDRGIGNAALGTAMFIGQLDEAGGFYAVDINSYNFSIAADQEGYAEAGLRFERPIGINNYVLGARVRRGSLSENSDFGVEGDTYGGTVVGEYLHGSLQFDAQLGYERVEVDSTNNTNDNIFAAAGTRYQYGAYNISLEGGIGEYDGESRRGASLGTRVDVARGVSLNTGVNYTYENDDDSVTALGSVRYEM